MKEMSNGKKREKYLNMCVGVSKIYGNDHFHHDDCEFAYFFRERRRVAAAREGV